MNFVDAAIALLEEAQQPLHVEELAKRAIEREMLERPGVNPLRSMKGRLTSELNRGEESRLVRVEDDLWALRGNSETAEELPVVNGGVEAVYGEEDISEFDSHDVRLRAMGEAADAEESKTDVELSVARAVADDEGSAIEAEEADQDDDEGHADEVVQPRRPLTPEEQQLSSIYGDESVETTSVGDVAEYRDEQTADEDRLMLPEIKAERHDRGRPRRERGRSRRERPPGRSGNKSESKEGARNDSRSDSRNRVPAELLAAWQRDADPIVLAAIEVLQQRRSQSQPVRQLTQAMRDKVELPGTPEQNWRLVKGVLARDESQRRARGLTARVAYRGRDLFALGSEPGADALGVAELGFERAAAALTSAHAETFRSRLKSLSTKMLERVVHVYLHAAGWTDISWIKRVEKSSYALATSSSASEPSMVSARTGSDDIDRRGVGELRAGLVAKGIASGLLLCPGELSEEAGDELDKEGPFVDVVCGDAFVDALARTGVGTTSRTVTVQVIDQDWLSAVLS